MCSFPVIDRIHNAGGSPDNGSVLVPYDVLKSEKRHECGLPLYSVIQHYIFYTGMPDDVNKERYILQENSAIIDRLIQGLVLNC